ncbi:MAG: hypothetical protein WKF75_01570 [Singulisphaera sp.]
MDQMTWEAETGRGRARPERRLRPGVRFVGGIRITYSYPETSGKPVLFRTFWRKSDREEFGDDRRYLNAFVERSAGEKTVTIWIADTIDEFRIHPDNRRGAFRISQITLLIPLGADPVHHHPWGAEGG